MQGNWLLDVFFYKQIFAEGYWQQAQPTFMSQKKNKAPKKTSALKSGLQRLTVQPEDPSAITAEYTKEPQSNFAFETQLLDKYRNYWLTGDWENITELDNTTLEEHPDRAKLALIVACAWQQMGSLESAKYFIKLAQDWGCDKKLIAQILVAGVHNTLGRAAALDGDSSRTLAHFQLAVKGVSGEKKHTARERVTKEITRLGLGFELGLPDNDRKKIMPVKPYFPFLPSNSLTEIGINNAQSCSTEIVSYAQNFEDVMLWRALRHVKNGFYIDVGAQDPVVDSVSKAFYEQGWRGIHIEATQHYAELLRQDRPDEIVIQAALNEVHGDMVFYEIVATGISTGDPEIAQSHQQKGFPIHEITVPCITLADVFREAGEQDIHWLKIDVEGMERAVLASWGKAATRPWIVVVESTLPLTQIESHDQWEYLLLERGYQAIYFDGLNRYYLSEYHAGLAEAFRSGPNVFDSFAFSGMSSTLFCSLINAKLSRKDQEITDLKRMLSEQTN